MSIFATISVAGSGRITPAKPTLQHVGYGTFKITNYNNSYTYTSSLISGSGTCSTPDSNGNIVFSSPTAAFNITAKSAKGISQSLPGQAYRQQNTTDMVYVQDWWGVVDCGSCTGGCPNYCGGCGECACSWYPDYYGPGQDACGRSTGCMVCYNHDYSGAGYTGAYGEWGKTA